MIELQMEGYSAVPLFGFKHLLNPLIWIVCLFRYNHFSAIVIAVQITNSL